MWPDHCVQNVESDIPPSMITQPGDIVLEKGGLDYVDAYSAFMDNARNIKTDLDSILMAFDVDTIYMMGIATDYGILYAASHAIGLDYKVYVILDGTRGIGDESTASAIKQMENEGAVVIDSQDLLARDCPAN